MNDDSYFSNWLAAQQERISASGLKYQQDAIKAFQDYGMPHRKQDPWKYVDNSSLLNLSMEEAGSNKQSHRVYHRDPGAHLLNFHNSKLVDALGISQEHGVQIQQLALNAELLSHSEKWKLCPSSLQQEENSYTLINAFSFTHAYHIEISRDLSQPLEIFFSGDAPYQAIRLYISVAEGCKASVLVNPSEIAGSSYWNPYFCYDLAEGAKLQLLERGSAAEARELQGIRSSSLRANISTRAELHSGIFYWGSKLCVHDARLAITGENANVNMQGLCFAEEQDAYHLRSEVQHLAPNSQSEHLYKNVLFDQAFTEFYGIIHADNNGIGTQASQQNRNLLLSDRARAVSRPQLEILIDDLKCQHGAATGSLDEEELFYMRARGLSRELAMQMAIIGFVEEICLNFPADQTARLGIDQALDFLLKKRKQAIA